jgi:hypothetical protein
MKNAEPGKTFCDLGCRHCGAVVTHRGARQTTLLHRLRQTMSYILGIF